MRKVLPVKFSEEEKAEVKKRAEKLRLSVSAYIRDRALGTLPEAAFVPEINWKVYMVLGEIQGQFEQLSERDEYTEVLDKLTTLLLEVRSASVGLR